MKKHRNDLILFICLTVVAFIALFAFVRLRTDGAKVLVTVDGKDFGEYSLSEDIKVRIGDETQGNTLIIKDGKAYIENATCPDKICEKNKIHYDGESLVCLPNKTVVTVKSADKAALDF